MDIGKLFEEMDALRDIIKNQTGPLESADPQLIVAMINGRMVVALATHVENVPVLDAYDTEEVCEEEAARLGLRRLAARLSGSKLPREHARGCARVQDFTGSAACDCGATNPEAS